jgi:hypothetical protein
LSPRRETGCGLFESDGSRTSRRHILPTRRRLSAVSELPSEPFISRHARTCRHAAWLKVHRKFQMPKTLTEIRADFQHLRRWRKSVEQAQSYTFKAVITIIVTGLVGAVWLGVKVMLGK